jgi:hypothetical protein
MFIESSTGEHQSTHGPNGTEESHSRDTATVTRNPTTSSDQLKHAVHGLNKSMMKLDTSSSERWVTTTALHAHKSIRDTLPQELDTRTQESMFIES